MYALTSVVRHVTLTFHYELYYYGGYMLINRYRFDKIVPASETTRAGFTYRTDAMRLVKYNWCRTLTNRGLCTEECSGCQAKILEGMKAIDPNVARSVTAVFIFNLRKQSSLLVEGVSLKNEQAPATTFVDALANLEAAIG
jgi:hypothetical protein